MVFSIGNLAMICIGSLFLYLAISKRYEPYLLLPIGFGALLINLFPDVMARGGFLSFLYTYGVLTDIFPYLIFIGIGAMIDFGALLERPYILLMGGAAQFGIFATLLASIQLGFKLPEASSIAIIGAMDGPSTIIMATKFAPHLLGPISVVAYSYMALVPMIQPPIMRLLTTKKERMTTMTYAKPVNPKVRIIFPIATTLIICYILPSATPIVGMLMLGNLFRESGVVQKLMEVSQDTLANTITLFLGVTVGATMNASVFLTLQTIEIMILGIVAFSMATAMGLLIGKLMYRFSGGKVNPLIGAAGVSAYPMSARVVQTEGQRENPQNHLLMHALAVNTGGQIASVVAVGIFLTLLST